MDRSNPCKFMQINGQRASAVDGQIRIKAVEEKISVILLQEPYVAFHKVSGYSLDSRVIVGCGGNEIPWAAIVVLDKNVSIVKLYEFSDTHVVCACMYGSFGELYVVSAYCQFRDPIDSYLYKLDNVLTALRGKPVLIGMDANAKSPLWHAEHADENGTMLEELILQHGLVVLNESGHDSTYASVHGESNIDVTLVSSAAAGVITNWSVWSDWCTSDHRCITVEAGTGLARHIELTNRYAVRRANWDLFDSCLHEAFDGDRFAEYDCLDVQAKTVCFQNCVLEACDRAIPRRSRVSGAVPWWSAELGRLRGRTNSLRRLMQRYRRRGDEAAYQNAKVDYLRSKNGYNQAIRRSKIDSWRKLVSEVGNGSPWGLVHKLVLSKINLDTVLTSVKPIGGGPATMTWSETVSAILEALIPDDSPAEDSVLQRSLRESVGSYSTPLVESDFDEMEIAMAINQCQVGKAPGIDLIEVEVLRSDCSLGG